MVTTHDHGAGVAEVINKVITGNLLRSNTPAPR
jgi:hypothetical protein